MPIGPKIDWSTLEVDYVRLQTTAAVAKEYGCTISAVQSALRRLGIPLIKPERGPCQDCKERPRYRNHSRCIPCLSAHRKATRTGECAVEICQEPIHAKGWCEGHYGRWYKTGDARADEPLVPRPPPKDIDWSNLEADYLRLRSQYRVAELYECEQSTVWRKMKEMGIQAIAGTPYTATDLEAGTKRCPRCQEIKPLSEFPIQKNRGGGGYGSYCRPCNTVHQRERKRARREAMTPEEREMDAQKWREYRKTHPRNTRKSMLKMTYGMSEDDYDNLLAFQEGECAICGSPDPGGRWARGNFPIDHDHATGEVRGLLCDRHNKGIGYFQDDPELLAAAIQYLLNPPYQQLKEESTCARTADVKDLTITTAVPFT